MINDYNIKSENNEQVLYIFLDFDVEFARLSKSKGKKKLINEIKDYIKRNKIIFKGTKVMLVSSGIVIGTLLLKEPTINYEKLNTNNNSISILMKENLEVKNENIIEENKEEKKEEKSEERINDKTENKNINVKKEKNEQIEDIIKKEIIKDSKIEDKKEEINNIENTLEDNKIYVKVYRENGSILNLEIEEYLIGVVAAEMPAEFNDQALMAQAILARTYTLKAIKNNKKLTDTSSTQNYKSNEELKNMWKDKYDIYYNKIKKAIDNTCGKYLTYDGQLIEAVYHSTSNGLTEDSKNVWGNSFPYLITVESKYDELNPSFIRETQITYEKLSTIFKTNINSETDINIISKTSGNRVDKIEIAGNIYTGVEVRTLLKLRSSDFEIIRNNVGIVFKTRGYGHGVGMSQYGANGMAKNGYSYDQILKHYYKGVTIQT